MTCLPLGILPPASAGVGGSQKDNLRPSVSVHDDLFNAPYKVADQHLSPAASRLVRQFPHQQSRWPSRVSDPRCTTLVPTALRTCSSSSIIAPAADARQSTVRQVPSKNVAVKGLDGHIASETS